MGKRAALISGGVNTRISLKEQLEGYIGRQVKVFETFFIKQ